MPGVQVVATLSTNQTGANSDYMKYVSGPITKTDKVNSPDLLDFSLLNYDGNMVRLVRGTHIVLRTATYNIWYAGYITNDPEPIYMGTSNGNPVWQYNYQATGEEYMLNLKPFGIMAPFTNTTQGAIIKALIARLSPPGVTFDVTGVQNGQAVPRFLVDPNQHFTSIVDTFSKAANYQFRCQNFSVTYAPLDAVSAAIAVDGSSTHFTPASLSVKTSGDPIINDSIVLGSIEPQSYMEEYFMGDGATATFPLISSVFGVDSTLLLQDDFTGNTIDNSKWTIYDTSAGFLQPYGSTLNVLGGNNNGPLDVSLQSQSLIPLEGSLRITHGEWDFISASDGIIGGLWTGQTNSAKTGLIFGIQVSPTVGGGTSLSPTTGSGTPSGGGSTLPGGGGTVPIRGTTAPTVTIDYNKRYVIRTLYTFGETKRASAQYSYKDQGGTVHQIGGVPAVEHFYATTIITELNPITAVMTNQWTWNTDLGSSLGNALYAYYVPVASNNLNLTVSGITISVPMQAALKSQPSGATDWTAQIIGPNEIDSLDGLAPAATIVDSNNGASTRSSLMGSANYNPGQATLTYFKNTAQLISYLPKAGDLIHLSYRGAGAAIGRAQSKASIATEAVGWGDDGVRSETKRDLNPLPKTSAECEMAAVARVNDNCYQHWSGTYSMPSGPWFTGEPVAGTILKFINLPTQFPASIQAEAITQVTSTFVSQTPKEVFNHQISFGPVSSVENVLAAIKSTDGVFTPQDTAEIPQFIDVSALGQTGIQSVPNFVYTGKDSTNWHFAFKGAFQTGTAGVEIRYSDSGWGPDDGNNLIARVASTSTTFTVPRTVRGKVAFLRCYDKRNGLIWSEDITQAAIGNGSITGTLVRQQGPTGAYQMVGNLTSHSAGAYCRPIVPSPVAGATSTTFSVSIRAPFGAQINVGFHSGGVALKLFTGTGKWQRYSVTATGSHNDPMLQPVSLNSTFQITQMSVEFGSQETIYCKTAGTPYGAVSRFSTGLHTALPMIPPSPTAKGNFTHIDAPLISAVLPADLTNVWGCEIRAANNVTVLFKTDLVNATLSLPSNTGDTSMVLQFKAPALTQRSYSYWVYTYNLFGEYSAGYNYAGTISPPSVSNLNIMVWGPHVVWTGTNATAYEVYVDKTDTTLQDLTVNGTTTNCFYKIPESEFTSLRYVAVTPYDAIGPGETMGGWFEFTGQANYITDPTFDYGNVSNPYWTLDPNWAIGQGHAADGNWAAYIAGSILTTFQTASAIRSTYQFPVTAGTSVFGQCMIDASSAGGSSTDLTVSYAAAYIQFYDAGYNLLGTVIGNNLPFGGTGWNLSRATGVAPANSAYYFTGCAVYNQEFGTVYVDLVEANIVPAAPTLVPVGQVYVKLGNVGPDHNIHVSTALNPQGSVLPNQPIPISYSVTDTQLSITCGAVSLLQADGGSLSVSGGTLNFTGLSQSTTYYIYSYIKVADGTYNTTSPNPPSSSPNTTQAMQANFDGRIDVGVLTVTTLATPSGGGHPPPNTGGGGGGGNCPESNELVEVLGKGKVRAGDVQAGDMLLGKSFSMGKDVYRRVIASYSQLGASWYMIDGYRCSPTEPVYYNDAWVIAFRVPGATFDTARGYKVKISVETDEYSEQNYYLVTQDNRLLIHNSRILDC